MSEPDNENSIALPDTRAGLIWRGIVGGIVTCYAGLMVLSGVLTALITYNEWIRYGPGPWRGWRFNYMSTLMCTWAGTHRRQNAVGRD